jgi:hypothetical protein
VVNAEVFVHNLAGFYAFSQGGRMDNPARIVEAGVLEMRKGTQLASAGQVEPPRPEFQTHPMVVGTFSRSTERDGHDVQTKQDYAASAVVNLRD